MSSYEPFSIFLCWPLRCSGWLCSKTEQFIGIWPVLYRNGFIPPSARSELNINKPNIYYAVTNMRVMLCITGRVNRFRDISYKRLGEVRLILSRRGTGCGTIVFVTPTHVPEYPYGRRYDRVANINSLLDSFVDIADAARIQPDAAKAGFEEQEIYPPETGSLGAGFRRPEIRRDASEEASKSAQNLPGGGYSCSFSATGQGTKK